MDIQLTNGRIVTLADLAQEHPDLFASGDRHYTEDASEWGEGDIVWPSFEAWCDAEDGDCDGALGRIIGVD